MKLQEKIFIYHIGNDFQILYEKKGVLPMAGKLYAVGPNHPIASLHDVPWDTLMPGDTVKIHWRREPYREKIVISRTGAKGAPITVSGVPGPNGELPVITGEYATVSEKYRHGNEPRCCVKIGSARFEGAFAGDGHGKPEGSVPEYIIVENLDLCDAHPNVPYYTPEGETAFHTKNASAIYLEFGSHITVRNNAMHNCGNGFFCAHGSKDVLIQGNRIFDNGVYQVMYEHNNYTSADGIIFEFNYFGPTKEGAIAGSLKDRSAGTVIRYNFFEGGNRALDLVESGRFKEMPHYRETFVYGNIMVDTTRPKCITAATAAARTDTARGPCIFITIP
jgi:hypothetical protein